jgi:hypothetical protein
MTDANLVRFLGRQTALGVGLVRHRGRRAGRDPAAAGWRRTASRHRRRHARQRHLISIGEAVCDFALVTGGSGLGLAPQHGGTGAAATAPTGDRRAGALPLRLGATNAQVRRFAATTHAKARPGAGRGRETAAISSLGARAWRGGPASSRRRRRPPRSRRRRRRSAPSGPLPWSRRLWRPWRGPSALRACAASSLPAARLREPWRPPSASRASWSGRRSRRACRGAPPTVPSPWRSP